MNREKCDCGGELKQVPSISQASPTPISEVVIGGRSPRYSTSIPYPFVYCVDCGLVYYQPEKQE